MCGCRVPVLGSFDDLVPRLHQHVRNGGEVWFYTCLFPAGKYDNRFIDYALIRTRLLQWFNFRYEKVADLLKEVLPISGSTNHETVREHRHAVGERMEAELGEERQPDPVKPEENPELPLPDGPMTVGRDGGYVRAAHKEGCFEVIAGRSVVAFRGREEEAVPPAKCFGFVQTYDSKPRRRLWELMKSQGMQENLRKSPVRTPALASRVSV